MHDENMKELEEFNDHSYDEALAIENEINILTGLIKMELDNLDGLDHSNVRKARSCMNKLDVLFIERLEYTERLDVLKGRRVIV